MRIQSYWTNALVLILVAALAYLPLVNRLGYTHDDWYLMASARAEGPGVFREIFSVDRPLRALVMIPAYKLFGGNPLYYNLSAYLFRVFGALALLWVLRILWPPQHIATMLMSLLFLIYPGFLAQPNAIDYQSHIVGLAAALLSLACTLKAVRTESRLSRIMLHAFSILLGWFYLGQMEWYIGIEFFRWACVFISLSRQRGTILQKIRQTVQRAYPALAIPLVFLIWRILLFKGERGATDVNIQFESVKLYPLQTIYHWAIQVIQDLFDVFLSAWIIPLSQLIGYIQRWGGLLAFIAAGSVLFFIRTLKKDDPQEGPSKFDIYRETLLLGLLTAIAGLIPIAMVNREVSFPAYSRYSVISSIGVAIFIVAALMCLKVKLLRNGIVAGLVIISMLVHHANAVRQAQETSASDTFWWQVSWRVPQFEKSTTLIANYPAGVIEEDYFVWGPASLIYYPEKQNPKVIQPGLFAAVLNPDTITKVLARERQEYDNRKNIITYKNYRNIVILTQPTANSCVHVINGVSPEYPQGEWDSIRAIGPYSELEHVLVEGMPHTPPEVVFGPEPARGWCYYYQKADLARQKGDWNDVVNIGNQAAEQGWSPMDLIEWMPFLQAYAQTGNVDRLTELAPNIRADPYISRQACQIIGSMPGLSQVVLETVNSLYCPK
jgi:hypothetical protein